MEQIACASHSTVEPSLLRTGPSSNSLLKRLQLTPRHKPSAAEKARMMEQKQQQTTVKREQPMIVKATECGEWKEWAEWGKCIGKCGTEGMRHRTRECRCSRQVWRIQRKSTSSEGVPALPRKVLLARFLSANRTSLRNKCSEPHVLSHNRAGQRNI